MFTCGSDLAETDGGLLECRALLTPWKKIHGVVSFQRRLLALEKSE